MSVRAKNLTECDGGAGGPIEVMGLLCIETLEEVARARCHKMLFVKTDSGLSKF